MATALRACSTSSSFRPATSPKSRIPMVVRCQAAPSMMTAAPVMAPPAPVPVALPSSDKVLHLAAPEVDNLLQIAGQKLCIVSVSTTWCGPCKVMGPELEKMAEELGAAAHIIKLDCTTEQPNRKWAMTQGVKALPTFILFKNGRRVSDMTGAKANALRRLIEAHI